MSNIKILTIAVFLLLCISVHAQDVVKWSFSVKKISTAVYEVHLTPAVASPWHIYSQTSPEGGALATKISFTKNPLVTIEGKTKEKGKVTSKYEEVFGVTVKYFEGPVDFVQLVRLKANAKTNITGTIEYMACTNEECLTPAEEAFNIPLQ